MLDVQAQGIITDAIFHYVQHVISSEDDGPCAELGEMVTAIWAVAAGDAPVRRLLVDTFIFYRWGSWHAGSGREEEKERLLRCLNQAPRDFSARVTVGLLEKMERPNGRAFALKNYKVITS